MFIVPVSRDTRHLSRLIDDTVERFVQSVSADAQAPSTRNPPLDVAESEAAYTVTLDVPGVNKEDVKVSVEGRTVSIQAESSASAAASASAERLVYRERQGARYARRFSLAAPVDEAQSVAKLENGVLTLTLPKRGAKAAAQLTVN